MQHLHAHFGTNSAEVAMLVHVLGGPPWSFTVHGPEEFDKPEFIGLPEKIRRAAFVVAVSSYRPQPAVSPGRSQRMEQDPRRPLWSRPGILRRAAELPLRSDIWSVLAGSANKRDSCC